MAFRMRKKPQAPKRTQNVFKVDIDTFDNLQELFDWVESSLPVDKKKAHITRHYHYNDDPSLVIHYSLLEPDQDFQMRVDEYNVELARWYDWYEKNKEALEKQKEEKALAKRVRALKEVKKLEKEISAIRERQAKLERSVDD